MTWSEEHERNIIWQDIFTERNNQDVTWGEIHSRNLMPENFLSILVEEVGEVAKAINEWYTSDLPGDDYRKELVQVAAVAVAAIEELDYRMGKRD